MTISEYLAKKNLTQVEFARQLNVSPALVSMWLTGERKPGLRTAFKLERLTGIKAASWDDPANGDTPPKPHRRKRAA